MTPSRCTPPRTPAHRRSGAGMVAVVVTSGAALAYVVFVIAEDPPSRGDSRHTSAGAVRGSRVVSRSC